MARESSLWSWLSAVRLAPGVDVHIGRLENYLYAGMPDVEGFANFHNGGPSGQFWFELKAIERPARLETPLRFPLKKREAQIQWLRRRWVLGGNAFFLLQVGSGFDRRLFLAPGDIGADLRNGMNESELMVRCARTGLFEKKHISRIDILRRAVTCRAMYHSRPLPFQS